MRVLLLLTSDAILIGHARACFRGLFWALWAGWDCHP
jgi:hypothetical protein